MPSVFPGMDPYIEGSDWEDFHANMISGIQAVLVPSLRPEYVIRTERRIYVESSFDDPQLIRPDLTIVRQPLTTSTRPHAAAATASEILPVERTIPIPFEVAEKFLVIRRLNSPEVVTVIELLSPGNKRRGSDGREAYLAKRDDVLLSRTNLVEIDLLRGGERLSTIEALPAGDFFAYVHRTARRGHVDVYAWPLSHRLPTIPIPLAPGDREVPLDLQNVLDEVYDRAGYDYSLDYRRPPTPPLGKTEAKWARGLVKAKARQP